MAEADVRYVPIIFLIGSAKTNDAYYRLIVQFKSRVNIVIKYVYYYNVHINTFDLFKNHLFVFRVI